MNEQDIINLIDQKISDTMLAPTSIGVVRHVHNGVDAPQIPVGNLLINADQGIQFSNGTTTNYQMYIIDKENGSGFVIEPSTGTFGGVGGTLYLGGGFVNNGQFLAIDMDVSDGTNFVGANLTPTGMNYSASGNFAIRLPDTTRPSPVAGMIAFEAGTFYVCKTTGTWTVLI